MRLLILPALAGLLCGCTAFGASSPDANLKMLLDHAETCDRDYTGGTGVGAAFTFHIACKARPLEAQPAAPPDAGPR